MSTTIEYIVDVEASIDEASALAKIVVDHLMLRGVVLATPQVSEFLGKGPQYATGPRVSEVAEHNDCFPCGLDVEIGRAVFTTGENGLDVLRCPHCAGQHELDDDDWCAAIGEWDEGRGPGLLACKQCGQTNPVTAWGFEPVWGFGNLAFKFSEWLLEPEFVDEVARLLGHKVAWVQSHW